MSAFADNARAVAIARDPYLDVFGTFWDGMSFMIASARGVQDRIAGQGPPPRFTTSSATVAFDRYVAHLSTGEAQWPAEFVVWQAFAHVIVESHGLLDEYLRACFELLALSELVAEEFDLEGDLTRELAESAREMEYRAFKEAGRFGQAVIWSRVARLRERFGVPLHIAPELEAALRHHRRIRGGIVHGQLTPHAVLPDGTVRRMRAYPPPPYVPLGIHVVRGALSVILAAHRAVDAAMLELLGIEEDPVTAALIQAEIDRGVPEWVIDPWEAHPEHLFDPLVLRMWKPG